MTWQDSLLDKLSAQPCWGYHPEGSPAAEPTALASLALGVWERDEAARRAAGWLVRLQASDGSVGVRHGEPTPRWPTSLAILAWHGAQARSDHSQQTLAGPLENSLRWTLTARSASLPLGTATAHDTTLVAWPWVEGTHAWVEPTALHVLALKVLGQKTHPRTREAVAVLRDRQLPDGGCNYGNTLVLGRQLRAHLQPTGLALLALGDEPQQDARRARSLDYLTNNLSLRTPTMSMCWSLLGLAAHGRLPAEAGSWLEKACQRTLARDRSPLKMALLLLADRGERCVKNEWRITDDQSA